MTDTWIECLGDLARYRMVIEEETEAHSSWAAAAARWYNAESDRRPPIGRLYHHLGVLERPSLRKMFHYAESLTCVGPFPNARDALHALYPPTPPIANDPQKKIKENSNPTIDQESKNQLATALSNYYFTKPCVAQRPTTANTLGGGDTEQPSATFEARASARRFFTRGRAFRVTWQEPAGEETAPATVSMFKRTSEVKSDMHDENVFSKLRRRISEGSKTITAVPIRTSGSSVVGKAGVIKSEHTIVYTGRQAPTPMPTEPDPRSPINSGKFRSVSSTAKRSHKKAQEYFEPSIDCDLDDHIASAFPDYGARANFVTRSYVNRRRLSINKASAGVFKNAIGKKIKTLGTVILSVRFKGETELHSVEFHVISNALWDVVLGRPFLDLTKTLTEFKHRVTRTLRHISSPRICYVSGSHQGIDGYLNGEAVNALPDTGSNILVMSTKYARSRGFYIRKSQRYRIEVTFADGSRAVTRGIVKGVAWQFGSSPEETYCRNVFVLDDLQCDFILSYEFLEETNAFARYKDSIVEVESDDADVPGFFGLREERNVFGNIKKKFKGRHADSQQGKFSLL